MGEALISVSSSASSQEFLPKALEEDDSFDDLPFEQLRQALREEVELSDKPNTRSRYQKKKYNLFIR
tara:strand:- start:288 stop:488 length:201 start_codon:yes stop_codon:yes gene_type:complete